jgi:hypothetical protein
MPHGACNALLVPGREFVGDFIDFLVVRVIAGLFITGLGWWFARGPYVERRGPRVTHGVTVMKRPSKTLIKVP